MQQRVAAIRGMHVGPADGSVNGCQNIVCGGTAKVAHRPERNFLRRADGDAGRGVGGEVCIAGLARSAGRADVEGVAEMAKPSARLALSVELTIASDCAEAAL